MDLAENAQHISEYFNKINLSELRKIFTNYNIREKNYIKGEIISTSGTNYTRTLFLVSGKVHSSLISENGQEIGISYFKPGDILGVLIPFSTGGKLPVNIICDNNSSVIWIPKEMLLELSTTQPEFLKTLFRSTADKIINISTMVNDIKFKKLKVRIYETFKDLSKNKNEFQLPYSKTKLAEVVGGTRPAVSRCITTLIKDGEIEVHGRKITML